MEYLSELEVLPLELKVRILKLDRCFGDPDAFRGECVCPLRDECLRACLHAFIRISDMMRKAVKPGTP
jgi:hypothetical protein